MRAIINLLKSLGCILEADSSDGDRGQGFINQNGEYLSRSEAYKVSISSGQPFNPEYILPNKKLDSSCIRHFSEDYELFDYLPINAGCCTSFEIRRECECGYGGVFGYKSKITGELL